MRLLGLLLVPRTYLASADVARWFPGPAVKWGWVAFDVTVACGLFALHRRWRTWLARLLVAATAADAVTTVIEGMSWNAPRVAGVAASGLLVAAMLAPVFATFVLGAALRRRRAEAIDCQ